MASARSSCEELLGWVGGRSSQKHAKTEGDVSHEAEVRCCGKDAGGGCSGCKRRVSGYQRRRGWLRLRSQAEKSRAPAAAGEGRVLQERCGDARSAAGFVGREGHRHKEQQAASWSDMFQAKRREAPEFGGVLSGHPTLARAIRWPGVWTLPRSWDTASCTDSGDDAASIAEAAPWPVSRILPSSSAASCPTPSSRSRSCDTDFYLMGKDLKRGSQVVSRRWGDHPRSGCTPGDPCPATEVVDLQAKGDATLRVTPDHPVQVPDARGELEKTLYLPAGQLKVGDWVVLDSGEASQLTGVNLQATECEVLKIVFEPDLPVAVFSSPPCIQSKGHNKEPSKRRAGEWKKGKAVVDPTDGAVSMPDTAVGSARIEMDLC